MPSPLAHFRRALASAVVEKLNLPSDQLEALEQQIRVPDAGRGDLALPCFAFAKRLQQNPADVARQAQVALEASGEWAKVEAAGPYVNVTLKTEQLASAVVPAARTENYGSSESGRGKTVVIDFSSPNIAKPLAFHHIRSTVIGAALGRLHAACGYKVVGLNYLGDWGKQFGLLAMGFQRYGDPAKRADAKHLVEVYVRANREADVAGKKEAIEAPKKARALHDTLAQLRTQPDDPKTAKNIKSLEKKIAETPPLEVLDAAAQKAAAELPLAEERDQEARLYFKKIEDGDPAAIAEWREFRNTSIAEFLRVYSRMGIEFTAIEGESFYTKALEKTVDEVRKQPGTEISDGAEIAKVDAKPPILLKTRDGTTLYITRDIAAAIDRYERFQFERSLYVVAADQALHFEQLFKLLGAMGKEWAKKCKHIAFGRVHGMSTRHGNVVFLDDVLDESVQKAREICEQSDRIDRDRLDETVEAIGVGGLVFGDLKNLRSSDYTFDRDTALSFEGHTAPYVQFSHARACSILKKGGGVPETADTSLLVLDEERAVLNALAAYPDVVEKACDDFEPSLVTRAILDLAQLTASYLTSGNRERQKRILVEDDPKLRDARLHLVDAVRNTLRHGLSLLGVRAPESM
jgi:arginyl-tRNA synthetase